MEHLQSVFVNVVRDDLEVVAVATCRVFCTIPSEMKLADLKKRFIVPYFNKRVVCYVTNDRFLSPVVSTDRNTAIRIHCQDIERVGTCYFFHQR